MTPFVSHVSILRVFNSFSFRLGSTDTFYLLSYRYSGFTGYGDEDRNLRLPHQKYSSCAAPPLAWLLFPLLCTYVCVRMHICLCAYVHTYVYICTYICMRM